MLTRWVEHGFYAQQGWSTWMAQHYIHSHLAVSLLQPQFTASGAQTVSQWPTTHPRFLWRILKEHFHIELPAKWLCRAWDCKHLGPCWVQSLLKPWRCSWWTEHYTWRWARSRGASAWCTDPDGRYNTFRFICTLFFTSVIPSESVQWKRLASTPTSLQLISDPKAKHSLSPVAWVHCLALPLWQKMGKFRLRRGDFAGAHKKQQAGSAPLPFGKGQQPGLGLNGFVLAGPWASNWGLLFFF